MQTYLKTRPVWIQLLIFIGIAFSLFVVLSFIGAPLLAKVTGISLLELQDVNKWDMKNPNMIIFIRGMLLLQFLGLFTIPSLIFARISDPRPLEYLRLKAPNHASYWILAIAAMLVAIPLVEYSGILNQQMIPGAAQKWVKSMEEEANKQIQFMLNRHTPSELLLNLVFISLFAGIGEELFFRGVLQRLFIRAFKNPWAGIITTALIFSAFHMQFLGFIPRFLLGVLLGAAYWYSGSLIVAMVAHFIYDGLFIVLAYLQPSMVQNSDATITDPAHMTLAALISLVLTFMVVWQMAKRSDTAYADVYKNDKPVQFNLDSEHGL